MFRKQFSILFVGLLLWTGNLQLVCAQTQPNSDAENVRTENIRNEIYRIGTNPKSKAVLTMKDGRKVKGSIARVTEETFVITESGTKQMTTFAYRDVTDVKRARTLNMTKLAIGAAVVTAIVVVVLVVPREPLLPGFCPLGCRSM